MSLRRQTRNGNTYPCALFLRLASQICSSLQRTSSQTHLYILPAEFAIYTPFLASLFIRRPSQSNPYLPFCLPDSESICYSPQAYFPPSQPIKPIFVAQQAEFEILTLLFAAFMRQFFKHPQSRSFKRLSPHDTGVYLGTSRACWPHFLDKDQFPSN